MLLALEEKERRGGTVDGLRGEGKLGEREGKEL